MVVEFTYSKKIPLQKQGDFEIVKICMIRIFGISPEF